MSIKPCCLWVMYTLLFFVEKSLSYQLSSSVLPTNYNIRIKLETDFFVTDKFQGDVNMTLNIMNKTQSIEIHVKNLITSTIMLANESTIFTIANIVHNTNNNILTINTQDILYPGLYYLFLHYNGMFSLSGTSGLYKSTYRNQNGEVRFFVSSIALKRNVFPCFDEPWIRSTFNLSVVVPKEFTVLANTENNVIQQISNNLQIVTFKPTPYMSSQSLGFVISEFTCSTINDNILYRVCSRPDLEEERQYALKTSVKFLKYFENFTKVPYNSSHLNKIDLVALPGKGVPSWGIPTFEESSILCSNNSDFCKQKVLTSIAGKISAMWFNNLVTAASWSDSFLHDGLNKYFQYVAAAELEPDWDLDKQFVVKELHSSLLEDSYGTTFPLSEKIDETLRNKGASIIRMVAQTIGVKQFQLGIQQYLQKFMFKSATNEDFWDSLQNFTELPYALSGVVKNWVLQPGYPVLNVTKNGTNIIITQEPFFLFGGDNSSTKWYVPVQYLTSNSSGEIWLTPNDDVIEGENIVINESDWIVLNNYQFGYYRVNYDQHLWTTIGSLLHTDYRKINPINRAQIIDDLFNLAKDSRISYSTVLNLISFLTNDVDYYSWYAAFNGFADILPRIRSDDARQKLTNYIKVLMENIYDNVLTDAENKNQIFGLKQELIFRWACLLNFSGTAETSRKYFLSYKNGDSVPNNLKMTIFCNSLRLSDYIERDAYFLWYKFVNTGSPSERSTILRAIGCIPKKSILNKFLQLAIGTCSEVQKLDFLELVKSVIVNNMEGVDVILDFFVDNYDEIFEYYQDEKIIGTVIKALGNMFTEKSQIDKILTLTQKKQITRAVKIHLENVVLLAKSNLKIFETVEKELVEYFENRENVLQQKSGSGLSYTFFILFILLFILFV